MGVIARPVSALESYKSAETTSITEEGRPFAVALYEIPKEILPEALQRGAEPGGIAELRETVEKIREVKRGL